MGRKTSPGHQLHSVPWRPVLPRLLVVLLVEAPDQFLEDRTHAVVVQAGMPNRTVGVLYRVGTQVDFRRGQFLDQCAKGIGLGKLWDLIAKLEVLKGCPGHCRKSRPR